MKSFHYFIKLLLHMIFMILCIIVILLPYTTVESTSSSSSSSATTTTTTSTTTPTAFVGNSRLLLLQRRRRQQQQQQEQKYNLISLSSSSSSLSTTTTTTTKQQQQLQHKEEEKDETKKKKNDWYSLRIQDDINYKSIVKSLFLRHIVVETIEMAKLTMNEYLSSYTTTTTTTTTTSDTTTNNNNNNEINIINNYKDPFGIIASKLSICPYSRNDSGTIGWIDIEPYINKNNYNNDNNNNNNDNNNNNENNNNNLVVSSSILPINVIQQLISKSPKMGDVYIIESTTTNQVHIIRVEELFLHRFKPTIVTTKTKTKTTTSTNNNSKNNNNNRIIGSHSGTNIMIPRPKLKGHGIMPELPNLFIDETTTTTTTKEINNNNNKNNKKNEDEEQAIKTYSIQTSGCQMNVADSERLAGVLEHELHLKLHDDVYNNNNDNNNENNKKKNKKNNKKKNKNNKNNNNTNTNNIPDVIIFNTCSIRDHAEQKLYNLLGPYCNLKRQPNNSKNFILIVTGCVAQQEGEELIRRIPEIDIVIGPQYIPFLKTIIENVDYGHQIVATEPMLHQEHETSYYTTNTNTDSDTTNTNIQQLQQNEYYQYQEPSLTLPITKPIRGHTVRAWVNVIHGCNEHCTYCVVPATRGMEQSRTMENILKECNDLILNGYKEITLLGQNIDAYGRDMIPKLTFSTLLEYLNNNIYEKIRIRYVTSHPRYFNDNVISIVANTTNKICECFHMPFQSGDDIVLKHMRRGYTYDKYISIINKIRKESPTNAAITGDVIVGFPGETNEQFLNTIKLMKYVKFDNLNTFAYSSRPNTEASYYPNSEHPNLKQIPEHIKKQRLYIVQQLAKEHGLLRSKQYLNTIQEILVEDYNPKNNKQIFGRTRQGRQVYFYGNLKKYQGTFVNVLITKAGTWSLIGELVIEENDEDNNNKDECDNDE